MGIILTFVASLVFVLGFIFFKSWEDKQEYRLFFHARDYLDNKTVHVVAYVSRLVLRIPEIFSPKRISRIAIRKFMHTLAYGARIMEKKTHALAMRLSYHDSENMNKKDPSEFLKTVVHHKEGLDNSVVNKDL